MNELYSNISYIVCYREASDERRNALLFTLRRFRQYFPSIEIIVVEQDAQSKLKLDKGLDYRHLFINNAGLFNRSWAFNCATKVTAKNIFVFADADIFLDKEGFIECFNATKAFEAITPNKKEISNVAIEEKSNDVHFLNIRKLHSFAGGMLIITRPAFEKTGGWDERFEGWGGEDDAMTHVIYNRLTSKTFDLPNFHIDHHHENITGNNHPQYKANKNLVEEILTNNGQSLDRYLKLLKSLDYGNPKKYTKDLSPEFKSSLKFVLAITTYNRLEYLKNCVESFLKTRDENIDWQLIIADDNSTDGTKEYLTQLKKEHNAVIIKNENTNIHHQVNTIIKSLSEMEFDVCFKCDDDIEFLKKGWDELYWSTMQRTGYDHLIFYDKQWQPHSNLTPPIQSGNLASNCLPQQIQGAFYTLTKDVINNVGYFDGQQFGTSGLGHIDFSFRSCRAGYNVIANPFDLVNSNEFIQLQSIHSYSSAISLKEKANSNSVNKIALKNLLLKRDRVFIPYNENLVTNSNSKDTSKLSARASKRATYKKYNKADATFYSERGISGFLGFLMKRMFNLSIDLKLYFIPMGIKLLGKTLNKISIHLLHIDQ